MSLTESGTSSVASAWDRYAVAYQNASRLPTDVVSYGPGIGTEADFRLIGAVSGKRAIDLGCGGGQNVIAFVKQGAVAIGVDISVEQLAFARRLTEQEEVRAELKHGDLAELAFQRADSVDVALSAYSLQYVPDLNRVFRQVHRVLKPQGIFVFSIPHPAAAMANEASSVVRTDQLTLEPAVMAIERSYFDQSPLEDRYEDATFTEFHRTASDVFMGLVRTGYRVDVMLEPQTKRGPVIPRALIVRARKEA